MPVYNIRTTTIDYCVEDEDVCSKFDNDPTIEEDSEEYYAAIEQEIKNIKNTLPQHIELTLECDEDDLDDLVCNEITERTGWLINSFEYETL